MANTNNVAAIRKRAQIMKANRTMFLWIAISSAVVGSALVVSYFLARTLIYNEKVLFEKNLTIGILDDNLNTVDELKSQIRVLDTNAALALVKANDSNQTVQVILDALPSDANSLALGASLQTKLLAGVEGVVGIDSLQVDPVVGIESLSDSTVVDVSTDTQATQNQITFQFAIKGDQNALKRVLENLQRSIRLIDIRTLRIESQGAVQVMTIQGRAYYEPAKTVELVDKVVPR